jgi:hypothetical protein
MGSVLRIYQYSLLLDSQAAAIYTSVRRLDSVLWTLTLCRNLASPNFYHVCEYLADASRICAPDAPKAWMDQQKQQLKSNHAHTVLEALKPFQEPTTVPDNLAVVRSAQRRAL